MLLFYVSEITTFIIRFLALVMALSTIGSLPYPDYGSYNNAQKFMNKIRFFSTHCSLLISN